MKVEGLRDASTNHALREKERSDEMEGSLFLGTACLVIGPERLRSAIKWYASCSRVMRLTAPGTSSARATSGLSLRCDGREMPV